MTSARIAPGTRSELGTVNWLFCRTASLVMRVPDVNLFSTLARQRGLFRAWLHFSARMMPGGKLSRYDTELVILRVSKLRACQYERDHHERIGRRAGIDAGKLARVDVGPADPQWSERERALLSGVDRLVEEKDLDDATWSALARHYTPEQLVELCLLVGQYEMLATTIRALRIQRDY
ncbi:MAG: carboxymuconolactone decarboxylase family protein [Polyangiales bacterium]